MKPITQHRIPNDTLNAAISIYRDERDPDAGNGSHIYQFILEEPGVAQDRYVGRLQFQHGPRESRESIPGLTTGTVLAALIDHIEGFQEGPYSCRENEWVLIKLEEALHWEQSRALDRMRRGVLGKNEA